MSTTRFVDRTVWISGAASGLGRATARLFAAEGANVWAADVNPDASPRHPRHPDGRREARVPCATSPTCLRAGSIEGTVGAFGGLNGRECAGVGRSAHSKR